MICALCRGTPCISLPTWGLKFHNLKIIYNAVFLGSICYGAPVWADRATTWVARRKLLQSQRLALIFLCKAYRTASTDALPVLAGVLPVDLEVQRRAALFYTSKAMQEPQFLKTGQRKRIDRLFGAPDTVIDKIMDEWQTRWDSSQTGRHLYKFFPSVKERLPKTWLDIDHFSSQFLTGHGNFKAKLYSFTLVDSPYCECSVPECQVEQTAEHILWECPLWAMERNIMLNSLNVTSGVVYYTDLVESRRNFKAFKVFCEAYYWKTSTSARI